MGLQALNKAVNHQNCRQSTKQSIHDHNLQQQIAKSADCMLNLDLYLSEMLNIAAGLQPDQNLKQKSRLEPEQSKDRQSKLHANQTTACSIRSCQSC